MKQRGFSPARVLTLGLTAFLVQILSTQAADPAPTSSRPVGVLPDSWGAIEEITLHFNEQLAVALEPLYRDLFRELADDVRIRVLCPSGDDARVFVRTWMPSLRGREVTVIDAGVPLSVWARDRCIPRQSIDLRDRANAFIPYPEPNYDNERENELLVCGWLSQERPEPAPPIEPLRIDGGNIVSNRRQVFFGANVLPENEGMEDAVLWRSVGLLAGREYVLVGDEHGEVPWCHVDMYLTPIDEDTVLVASPRLGLELTGEACDEDADPMTDPGLGAACLADMLQERFDAVVTLLADHGYRVRRVPALVNVADEWMVTYNNVLIDDRSDRRTVYVPIYGLPVLDEVAVAIYIGLGFDVRTVDVSNVFASGGALRCVVNVTQRRPPDIAASARTRRVRFATLTDRGPVARHTLWPRRRLTARQPVLEGTTR